MKALVPIKNIWVLVVAKTYSENSGPNCPRHLSSSALQRLDIGTPRIAANVLDFLIYKRLEAAGRLTRPKHWQEFIPFAMAHTPLKMSIDEAHNEVRIGWANSYSPQAIERRWNPSTASRWLIASTSL